MITWWHAIEIYRRPRLIAIFCLGISSGFPLTLVLSTLGYWLAEEGVSKATIGYLALVSLPYALKFLWSPLIDAMPLPYLSRKFGRRRGWLFFIQAGLTAAIIGLGMTSPDQNAFLTGILALCVAFMSASQDIVIDAYRIEILEDDELPAGSVMIQFGSRIGYLVAGVGGLILADQFGWNMAYWLLSLLVLFGVVAAYLCGEKAARPSPVEQQKDWASIIYHTVIMPFREFMDRRGWLLILLFVALLKVGDSMASVMTPPLIVELGFSKLEIAFANKSVGFVAVLAGTFMGGMMMQVTGTYKGLLIAAVLMMVSNLSFAALAYVGYDVPFLIFTIGFENFASGMGAGVLVAYLSGLCNVAYTATQYALLSSLAALARGFLSATSGDLAEYLGWEAFFIMTTLAALPGIVLLVMLHRAGGIGDTLKVSGR